MADGISFNMATGPFQSMIADKRARMPRAGMYAVRAAGRVAKQTGRAKAPVWKGATLKESGLRRLRKGGFNTSAAYQQAVPGLLKASITSTKNIKRLGDGSYSIKVGPRGARVHLYAHKIEEQAGYMAAAEAAAHAALPAIAQAAFDKVWKT